VRNKAKLSLSSGENPNPTRMNPVCDDGVTEQDDVFFVGNLLVTTVVIAKQQRQQTVELEEVVDVDTVVLPHSDGEVGGAGIYSDTRTISFSSHGKRSRDGCGALLPWCRAWNRDRHRKGSQHWGICRWPVWVSPFLRIRLKRNVVV